MMIPTWGKNPLSKLWPHGHQTSDQAFAQRPEVWHLQPLPETVGGEGENLRRL
jgi:hypothetical protein